MELYNYDFSEYDGEDVDTEGHYAFTYPESSWKDPTKQPYFIYADHQLAGFILVDTCCHYIQEPGAHNIADFFVMKKYQKRGVGRQAAEKMFERYPGKWEVRPYPLSPVSRVFWNKVLSRYTGGHCELHRDAPNDFGYTFDTRTFLRAVTSMPLSVTANAAYLAH